MKKKTIWLISGILLLFLLMLLFARKIVDNVREQTSDIQEYEELLGEKGRYKENLVKYNDIFPDSLENVSKVEDFVYLYYNPWDPNYFGYLVCIYSEEKFEEEVMRLRSIQSTEYKGVYGIEEFPYELCAVYADEIYGVIYALADSQQQKIVYVALEFCNYFTDIAYEKKMDEQYLPTGFNANYGNATRKAFDNKDK